VTVPKKKAVINPLLRTSLQLLFETLALHHDN